MHGLQKISQLIRRKRTMTNVLAINAGSSSLKVQLIQMPEEIVKAHGVFERIGLGNSIFTMEVGDQKEEFTGDIMNHEEAVEQMLSLLTESGSIESLDEINAVGHRVVHGGEQF